MSREPIVFVIDDDAAVREAISSLLNSVNMAVEVFASVPDFLKKEIPDRPACLVLDVRLPGMSGLEFQRELAHRDRPLSIIFITGHGDIPMSVEAMKAGAFEFLTKPVRGQVLLDAIHKAIEQNRATLDDLAKTTVLRNRFATLTRREREVMHLVDAGLMNKQVAAQLGASERTVKIHRAQVMRKMEAESLPDLVRMAQKLGVPAQRC